MGFQDLEIKEYKIIHWDNFGKEIIRINLYLSGGLIGVIHFFKDGNTVKKPEMLGRIIHLRYSYSEYDAIITTLRYERPVYLFYNRADEAQPFGGIKTGAEPVGEEES